MGEIVVKAKDAAEMFWQALDERERRFLMLVTVYACASVWFAASKKTRDRERARLRADILEELRRG